MRRPDVPSPCLLRSQCISAALTSSCKRPEGKPVFWSPGLVPSRNPCCDLTAFSPPRASWGSLVSGDRGHLWDSFLSVLLEASPRLGIMRRRRMNCSAPLMVASGVGLLCSALPVAYRTLEGSKDPPESEAFLCGEFVFIPPDKRQVRFSLFRRSEFLFFHCQVSSPPCRLVPTRPPPGGPFLRGAGEERLP